MKRGLVGIVLLALLFAMGCGSKPQVGYFTLTSIEKDGKSAQNTDGYLVLEEDGTGYGRLGRDTMSLTWEEGGLIWDNQFCAMTASEEGLCVKSEDMTLQYTRSADSAPEKPEHPSYSIRRASGKYDWYAVEMDGKTYKLSTLGEGYEGYVRFAEDGTGEFYIKTGVQSQGATTALMITDDGDLVDNTGYEIDYDFDGTSLLLTIDGDQYLYVSEQSTAE